MALHGTVERFLDWLYAEVLVPAGLRLGDVWWVLERIPEFLASLVILSALSGRPFEVGDRVRESIDVSVVVVLPTLDVKRRELRAARGSLDEREAQG
jgi:hypothetical protein